MLNTISLTGTMADSPEFCSEHTTVTIANNRVVSRGIIYSPGFPDRYNSKSQDGKPCTVTIKGLFDSSWIKLEQEYIELYGRGIRQTFQPCIEAGFKIYNDSFDQNLFHCPPREGALFDQKFFTISLHFAQRETAPFIIKYTGTYMYASKRSYPHSVLD